MFRNDKTKRVFLSLQDLSSFEDFFLTQSRYKNSMWHAFLRLDGVRNFKSANRIHPSYSMRLDSFILNTWVNEFDHLRPLFSKLFPPEVIQETKQILSCGFLRPSDVTAFMLVRSGMVEQYREFINNTKNTLFP